MHDNIDNYVIIAKKIYNIFNRIKNLICDFKNTYHSRYNKFYIFRALTCK